MGDEEEGKVRIGRGGTGVRAKSAGWESEVFFWGSGGGTRCII